MFEPKEDSEARATERKGKMVERRERASKKRKVETRGQRGAAVR